MENQAICQAFLKTPLFISHNNLYILRQMWKKNEWKNIKQTRRDYCWSEKVKEPSFCSFLLRIGSKCRKP